MQTVKTLDLQLLTDSYSVNTMERFNKFCIRRICSFTILFFGLYVLYNFKNINLANYESKEEQRSLREETKWSEGWPKVDISSINDKSPLALPRVGLVSFPGSGNTWVRALIRQATGIWTGSSYYDHHLFKQGFKAELDKCDKNDGTIVVKAHLTERPNCTFDKIIFLVRDPFRFLLSEFNWRRTRSHTGFAPNGLFGKPEWDKHVSVRTKDWVRSTKKWLKNFANDDVNNIDYSAPPTSNQKILLVSYERLKRKVVPEIQRIAKFLGLKVFRKKCIKVNTDVFKRKESLRDAECLFNNNHRGIVNQAIKDVEDFSKQLGVVGISSEFDKVFKEDQQMCSGWKLKQKKLDPVG